MDINTCYEITKDAHAVAYYTHLSPIAISFLLSIYLLVKTNYSLLSKIFFYFVLGFNIWLMCDIVTWVTQSYYMEAYFWSFFDYTNVLFFLFGLYFFAVIVYRTDISNRWKWIGLLISLPAFFIVVTGNSIHDFDQATCGNNLGDPSLDLYKNVVEFLVMGAIAFLTIRTVMYEKVSAIRNQALIVGLALLLFFGTFTFTDYLSVQTNIYQIGLYGLFALPLFLGAIVYSIVRYHTFNVKVLGAQALVVSLIALIASEYLFVQNTINRSLVTLTLVVTVFFGYFLVRSVKREVKQRELIEAQEKELEVANKQQEGLLHFISHEVKGYLTKSEAGFASIAEGDFGAMVPQALKTMATAALGEVRKGVATVIDILDASNLKKGTVSYAKKPFDFKKAIQDVVQDLRPSAEEKHLTIDVSLEHGQFMLWGDEEKIRQHAIRNLIDNAIKYTPAGSVHVELKHDDGKIRFSVKDNGVGITPEDMQNLFTEGGHGKDSIKVNVHSTGYGLFIAKQVIEAHKGKIWAQSEGQGKGSTFVIELPVT